MQISGSKFSATSWSFLIIFAGSFRVRAYRGPGLPTFWSSALIPEFFGVEEMRPNETISETLRQSDKTVPKNSGGQLGRMRPTRHASGPKVYHLPPMNLTKNTSIIDFCVNVLLRRLRRQSETVPKTMRHFETK